MVKKMNGLSRDLIIHPGETLKELLEDREMSQRELAMRTDVTEKHISGVVNGKKSISTNFAKKLEYALGIDSSFWINLQANYDKELADFEELNNISSDELEILKKLKSIVEYFKELKLIDKGLNDSMLVLELRTILKLSSLKRIPDVSQTGAYKISLATNVDPYILFTWLRICDLISSNETLNSVLDIEKLKKKTPYIKQLMFEDISNVQTKLKSYFAECGIKFSIVKYFRGAPIQGVIKKDSDGTLSLIMTTRQKFADIFWFTLFHEIGHIINGDIEDRLIDYDFTKNEVEEKADGFARDILIKQKEYETFVAKEDFSLTAIEEFCSEKLIPNYILIGRLQRDGYLKYHEYASEKVKYQLKEVSSERI